MREFAIIFDLTWEYEFTPAEFLENKKYDRESVLWSSNTQAGVFLHENVEWVAIYTWEK